MSASADERDAWVSAINEALEVSGEVRPPPGYAASGGRAKGDVAAFEAAIARASKAHDRASFARALCGEESLGDTPSYSDGEARRWLGRAPDAFPAAAARFRVPVAWVRDRHLALTRTVEQSPRRRRRRASGGAAPGGRAAAEVATDHAPQPVDRLFTQMRKDMRRDRVSIDGEVVAPDPGADAHEAIAAALARRLLEEARADRGPSRLGTQGDAPLSLLTEARARAKAERSGYLPTPSSRSNRTRRPAVSWDRPVLGSPTTGGHVLGAFVPEALKY